MDGSSNRGSRGVDLNLPNYRLGKTLGIGAFSKVKVAEHVPTGHKVAIKILNRRRIRSMRMEEKVSREMKISKLFMHPHIIRIYEVIETSTDIYVVMEYMKSGELFDYIVEKGRLQDEEARKIFQQIICGVEHCHRNMVVHRDLKPENLLLDSERNVKIADFGLSNIMQDGHFLKTSCGSPNYAAPEVISGKLYAGPEIDVWSCGVILYALLCGALPFDDENIPNLYKKIKHGMYTLPSHLSAGARDLIPRMLIVDPMNRITIPEIQQHHWFRAYLPRYLAVPLPNTMEQAKMMNFCGGDITVSRFAKEYDLAEVNSFVFLENSFNSYQICGFYKIDEKILQEVVRMGFDRRELIEFLHNRIQNEATVAYYLLLDNRSHVSTGYLREEFQETLEHGFNQMHPSEPVSSAIGQGLPGYMDVQVSPQLDLRAQFPIERKWNLGLQSRAHPREIMTEVLKALQQLNVCWKKMGNYCTKCRWVASSLDHHEGAVNFPAHSNHYFGDESSIIENDGVNHSPNVVKFEMQLYKTHDEKYLLDLQRVQGPQLLFLDLCAAFLTKLRVI